jgi:predicted molibdopterin-dependent oxidoreductase YjgC
MTQRPILKRLCEHERVPVSFSFDGVPLAGLAGDTVLTAVLSHGSQLRLTEFSGVPRAGFCLMGACQDCWVATSDGRRLRACSTSLVDGMELVTLNGPKRGGDK